MSNSKILTSEEVEAMLLTVRADGLTPLTLEQRDDLLATVRQLLSENERLLKLYNSAWLWVQQRVKHPNSGMPPAAMTLMEMLPLLPVSMRSLCVETVKAMIEYEAVNGERRGAMIDVVRELESVSIQEQKS